MTAYNLFDHLGQPVSLGQRLGTGGEGSVFEIASSSEFVAKVYHKPPGSQTEAKLRAMVALSRAELVKAAAWPTATLHERAGGPAVGLMMRRIKDFREIHTLYSPAHRKTTFPRADWRFLVTVALNCAATLENVHACGVVVGDVNQSNVLVSDAGLITLIDCDSFQVQVNGRTFPCEVGVPLFTPPELQNQSFRGILRTPNHDRFGLAVLLFHLLFMGRHPFSGRYLGSGDMPIERAIAEYRFVYGVAARTHSMQLPLHALALSAVSPQLAGLFERAFARGSESMGARPSGADWFAALKQFQQSLRLCPADPGHFYPPHLASCCWCDLMRQGSPNFFVSVAFFRPATSVGPAFVLAAVWAKIEQVPSPNVTYRRPPVPSGGRPVPLPSGVPTAPPAKPAPPSILVSPPAPPPRTIPAPSRQRVHIRPTDTQLIVGVVALAAFPVGIGSLILSLKIFAIAALLSLFVFGIWWLVLEIPRRMEIQQANREYEEEVAALRVEAARRRQEWENQLAKAQAFAREQYEKLLRPWKTTFERFQGERAKRKKAKEEAEQRLQAAEANWAAAASRYATAFQAKKQDLSKLRQRHEELALSYARERQQLQGRARDMQLETFLQQYFISAAAIDNIGPTRKATLASFGIETACDVVGDAVLQVPGFGEKLTARLIDWRQGIERQFVFNPAIGVPLREQQTLDIKYATIRQPVETQLRDGEGDLRAILAQAERELRSLHEHICSCLQELAQVQLDLSVYPSGI